MEREQRTQILRDLDKKIVMVSGPRQVGKTTLAKMLSENPDYFNYDHPEHRILLARGEWDRTKKLIIFDELHKMKHWKSWLKGIYDVEGIPPALLVTGSARLDMLRKTGESMAGRYFHHRLHPFDIKELRGEMDAEQVLKRLLKVGGFPEPFLNGDPAFYRRWRRTHLDVILRQDLLDLASVQHIQSVETLTELLRRRVGSTVAYANLAGDLQCDAKTVKRWMGLLENLYVIFPVRPHSGKIARSLLKASKLYFTDSGQVEGDVGARLENVVACALLKEVHRLQDQRGENIHLHYLRTKEGRELDFVIVRDEQVEWMIEVKHKDARPSPHLSYFGKLFPQARKLQLVAELDRERSTPTGVEIRKASSWLSEFQLIPKRADSS